MAMPENNNQPRRPNLPGGPGDRGKSPRTVYTWVLLLVLCGMLLMTWGNLDGGAETISFSEFRARVENEEVESVEVYDERLAGVMKPEGMAGKEAGSSEKFEVVINMLAIEQEDFVALLNEHGVQYEYVHRSTLLQMLGMMLPWILIIGFMYFFVFRQLRGGGAGMLGTFGRSRHRVSAKGQTKVTFEDVAGIDEAKDEVEEIIEFLRNPKKFQRLGGRIPRGILLVGLPGCGKTLLAKAIAGEADVPFFSISGSDFVEMFVGVGASRVRDLFKQAKDNSPCIIFLDEIDAVGRKRGAGISGGGHDEREQTLNAILVEMDGFSTNDQVIVIAATNRADVLDHALVRPGRFDRQIYVPLPDVRGRMEILRVHAKKVKLGPDTDLHRLARGTPMFSGADLEAIINEAALAATMGEKEFIEMDDLEEARDKVRWGRARRSREVDEKEKVTTAYHESGHALVQSLLRDADPLHKVSIIPRSGMGGATFSLPERDRTLYTRKYCLAQIRVCFGGRIAEELFMGDISSGAAADIQQGTEIARRMVMEWGMSDKLGFIKYAGDESQGFFAELGGNRDYSDKTAELIDSEIQQIMNDAYAESQGLIEGHRDEMNKLEEALLKYETLDGEEVKQIIKGQPLNKPTVADLLAREEEKSPGEAGGEDSAAADDRLPEGPMPNPSFG